MFTLYKIFNKDLSFYHLSHLCEFYTKCLEKREKTLLSHTFCGSSRKNLKNAVFHILRKLRTKFLKRREKHRFLTLFCRTSRKKLKKRCFSEFLANFVQSVSINVEKTLFTKLFCRTSRKKLKKRCFFRIFCKLFKYKLSRRTWKNTVFSHIFRWMSRKKLEERCFSHFCELCTKCLEKREKTLFYHTFCETSLKNIKKTLFLRMFRHLCTKCLEKR